VVSLGLVLGGGVGVFVARQGIGMPSKTSYVAKADAICRAGNGAVASVAKPTSYPDLVTALGTIVTASDAQLGQLHQLKLPGGAGRYQANAALGALTSTNQAAHRLQDAAGRKDDAATATAARQMTAAFGDAGTKAKALGFTACAVGMDAAVQNVVGGSKTLVKAGFVAKADTLCREVARKLSAIPKPSSDGRDVARYLGQALSVADKMVADLKALPVPPGDESTVADMWAVQEKVNAKVVEMKTAAAAGDRSRFAAADSESTVLGTAADAKLDAYGLGICGSNFGKR